MSHQAYAVSPTTLGRTFGTLALAFGAAALCEWLGTPIPWMLGPLLCTALATLASAPTYSSLILRNAGQWIMGTSLGLYFVPDIGLQILGIWWAVLLYVGWSLGLASVSGYLLFRFHRARMPDVPPQVLRSTTFFASLIGGASEMTLLAQSFGARGDLVAAAQSVRIVLVVTIMPFAVLVAGSAWDLHPLPSLMFNISAVQFPGLLLLGAMTCIGGWLMAKLRMANPWFLGPLFVAMALTLSGHTLSVVPSALSKAAQLLIGVSLGVRFVPKMMLKTPVWIVSVVISTLCVVALSACFGLLLAGLTGMHPASAILATAPGGVTEMSITAKVLQLGVPAVVALQASRLVVLLIVARPVHRLVMARASHESLGQR